MPLPPAERPLREGGKGEARPAIADDGKMDESTARLNKASPPERPSLTDAKPVAPGESLRILVVDDDSSLREEIALYLESDGHQVQRAASGQAALHSVDTFHPQMLITGWMVQDMDGIELCRQLRRSRAGRFLYIMMVTRQDDEDSLVPCFEAGIDDFIAKPLSARVLLARVRGGSRVIHWRREVAQARREQNEREQLRQRLQQAQKIQSLGRLTGGIAHNFNNMLASILGYTELAMEMYADVDGGTLKEFLDNIHRAGCDARDLVASLRAFSEGGCASRKTPLRRPLLEDVTQMLRPILPAGISLKTDFDDAVGEVMVDQEQVYQMVMNLSLNARDAMQGNGEISIALRNVHHPHTLCASCHEWFGGDYLELVLCDAGCGMDEQTQSAIFDPFFSTKEVGHGSGLGLSMVHGILHGYGGHVTIESAPGAGCCVHLLFPLTAPETGSE